MALGGGLIPPHQGSERLLLLDFLTRQRELVLWKLDGLDDAAARAVTTPSGMGVHGLVQHLTSVERSWLRKHFAGQEGLTFAWDPEAPDDAGMAVPPGTTLQELLTAYREEIEACDAVVAAHDLDAIGVHRDHSLRWVLLHLVEETSRHLGHLDLLAEQADGRVGEEPGGAPPPGEDP